MTLRTRIQRITTSASLLGWSATMKVMLAHLFAYDPSKDRSFDKRFKTDTTSRVERFSLDIQEDQTKSSAESYVSCPPKFERHILKTLGIAYKDFDFVDMGSGKGRVLMLASDWPFCSITGVEISKNLCAVAERNLALYPTARRKCSSIAIRVMDARTFPIANENTVFHFYHPFGKEILRPVLERIAARFRMSAKTVFIVYIWSQVQDLFPLFDDLNFKRLRHVQSLNTRYQYAVFAMGKTK